MRNWTEGQLECLYEIASRNPGWLSKLQTNMNVSEEDVRYLEWLDERMSEMAKKVEKLQSEPEELVARQLMKVNDHIHAIEKEAERYYGEEKFFFLGLSEIDDLMSKRWKLRNALLSKCLPDREVRISHDEIERARQVPLYSVIKNLPKNRFILCPSHKEKTPSFKVFERGYCFGCGFMMDSIDYVMNSMSYSFIQAVRYLNGK
jgi:hypothetical protein